MRAFFTSIVFLFLVNGNLLAQRAEVDKYLAQKRTFEQTDKYLNDTSYVLLINNLAVAYYTFQPDSCYRYALLASELSAKQGFTKGKVDALANMGLALWAKGDYSKALEQYFEALAMADKANYIEGEGLILSDIANIYRSQKKYELALENYKKSLEIREILKQDKGKASVLNNMAITYEMAGNWNDAISYNRKSLEVSQKIGFVLGQARSYDNLGWVSIKMGNFAEAKGYLEKSLELNEVAGDQALFSQIYQGLAEVYLQQKNATTALLYAEKALAISNIMQSKPKIRDSHEMLSRIYEAKSDFGQSLKHYKLFKLYTDSVLNIESEKKSLELANQFEQEKKDAVYMAEKQLHDQELSFQKYISFFSLIGLGLVLGLVFFVLRSRRKIQRAHALLGTQQKEILEQKRALEAKGFELKQSNEELAVTNEELQQIQEEVVAQRDALEVVNQSLQEKQLQINGSIQVAKTIQEAVLPSERKMCDLFKEHFVLNLPRDGVSGDFYWANKVQGKTFLALADCTGHGVPGAFMTLIGNNLLDKIIRVRGVLDVKDVLDMLHSEILTLLRQEETQNNHGMDMCLLSLEEKEQGIELSFAGAKRPLFYLPNASKELQEVKGARKSIGGIQFENSYFHKESIFLPKGSVLYLFSDGIVDQCNIDRQRFGNQRLKEAILAKSSEDLTVQQRQIQKEFAAFSAGAEQRDDILLLAVKL